MPIREYFAIGADGKAVEGVTVLRDPQTGQLYEVIRVMSGRMPTPPDDRPRGGTWLSACALYGGKRGGE